MIIYDTDTGDEIHCTFDADGNVLDGRGRRLEPLFYEISVMSPEEMRKSSPAWQDKITWRTKLSNMVRKRRTNAGR